MTALTCARSGCDGTIDGDGFCDRCGMEAPPPAAAGTGPLGSGAGGSAGTGSAGGGPSAVSGAGSTGPGPVGTGSAANGAGTAGPDGSTSSGTGTGPAATGSAARPGVGAATGPSGTAPGTSAWSAPTPVPEPRTGSGSAGSRSRRSSTRSAGRGRLGAGLVEVPLVPYRDPKDAVLTDPEVPEAKRYCSGCGRQVGRSRDGRPGRAEGFCAECGHRYSFTPKLVPGEVLHDQYEVLGCLAHGGLGWIYLAADHAVSDRWVVLKGLLDSGDEDAMAAAMAERRFLAEVEHPNIVKIHNFVRHADRATGELVDYIVMEYAGGTSVKDMINRLRLAGTGHESLPPAQAIAYALEVLPALGYLHDVGLLYCDFKPDNVIQTEEQLKLIDLGAVRRVDDRQSPIYGTIGYQAPEIGKAGPSVSSDLYTVGRALAVMTFRFDFRTTYKESLPEDVPLLDRHDSLRRFLVRATHREPRRRFSSAEEMAEQLTGVLREVLAQEDDVPRPGLSRRFTPERRAFGTDGVPDARAVAAALPVPNVDPADAAATFLMTASGDPDELRAAPAVTTEVRLRLARVLAEAGRTEEAAEELDHVPADWRGRWYRGVVALVAGRPDRARKLFDGVCDLLPGEAAPKLALAACAELAGEDAAPFHRVVWRTDRSYVSAGFGLARALLAVDDRDGAVAVLHSVPATSSHHLAAQLAAVRAQAGGGLSDVLAAGTRLAGLDLDAQRRAEITVELLAAALAAVRSTPPPPGRLLGFPLDEPGLRTGLERCYRQLARHADTPEERIALVDRANAVRPRTLV
ncbi:serine/threonine-protein kinase [Saccharothrix violaceirubra]|uniref:non-specific serine/threonine protein kinase n=1 Tax=Saccharothrix violaceirubra TaxID=413306 RepID=A0A7W7T3X4_9PSEU|nr:serine/threonine-protein kinase [Saccharothrix violaceirubra]MBB4965861.1 serine/threonine-protein kinase PknG [Saccharothrix violaceirubra]